MTAKKSRRPKPAKGADPPRQPPPGSGPAAAWRTPACFLLLSALVLLAFWPAADVAFVFDDQQYLLDNPPVRAGLTADGARWALTAQYANNWHPLTWISHMVDVSLFGLAPYGPRIENVLLHGLNAALLLALLRALTGSLWASAAVAAFFALHPLRAESVAWVSERKDLLAALFMLLALTAHLRWLRRGGRLRYASVAVLFALGLCAKPMIVTFPFLLLLLDVWPLGRARLPGSPGTLGWGRLLAEKAPLIALAAASSAITYHVQQSGGAMVATALSPLGPRVLNALVSLMRYLGSTAWPADLAFFYPHPGAGVSTPHAAAAALLLVVVSLAAAARWRRSPGGLVGWLWFLGMLVPVLGLVQVGAAARADRYTYLPHVGLFVGLVWGGAPLLGPRARRAAGGVLAAAALALVPATRSQVATWHDEVSLCTRAIAVTSGNWLAHDNLGTEYFSRGEYALAERHYREALGVQPWSPTRHFHLAMALEKLGRGPEAARHYRMAEAIRRAVRPPGGK